MQHPPHFPGLRAAPWRARLRQSLAVYASLPRLFRLGAAASPRRAVAMFAIYLLFSLLQPASVWFSKLLVDAVRLNQGTTALLIAGGMANRILVLEGGRIVEAGSHTDLVALGGRYAMLYEMQAGRYR